MKKSELMKTNPLLQPFADGGPDLFPAFDKIKPEHFKPALDMALAEARRLSRKIRDNPHAPTFENTVLEFEKATGMLDYVFGVFYYYSYASRSPEIEKLEETIFPRLIKLYGEVYSEDAAYKRFKKLEAQKDKLGLDKQQSYLLEVYSETFRYYGCHLSKTKKARMQEVDEELTRLGTSFDYNLQQQRKAYGLVVEDIKDLDGLPADVIQACAEEAVKRGQPGKWILTAEDSIDVNVMSYAHNRALRERYYREVGMIGTAKDGDNRDVMKDILKLRHERAQLSGYKSYADFAMTFQMSLTKRATMSFLNDVKKQATPTARKDVAMIKRYAREHGVRDLQPWDFGYYFEKLRKEKLSFNSESLRPYLSFENVMNGSFAVCQKVLGVRFDYNKSYPKIDKDTFAFDVYEEETGEHLGVLVVDPYLRDSKVGGYCSIELLSHGNYGSKNTKALAVLQLNFARPTKDHPTLLSEEEAKTIFHEIGHGLHTLLGKADHKLLSGLTCLTPDFKELPSQLLENWALEPEILNMYARHHITGEPVPPELIERLQENNRFMGGHKLMRKLRLSYMDLALHGRNPENLNLTTFEPKFLRDNFPLMAYPNLAPTIPWFDHIASGGYEATYYSYLWSEALDADSFKMFKKNGLFDPETCKRLRTMLKAAGTEMGGDLYRAFTGHDIHSGALLERYGIGRNRLKFNLVADNSHRFEAANKNRVDDSPANNAADPMLKTAIRGKPGPTPT